MTFPHWDLSDTNQVLESRNVARKIHSLFFKPFMAENLRALRADEEVDEGFRG